MDIHNKYIVSSTKYTVLSLIVGLCFVCTLYVHACSISCLYTRRDDFSIYYSIYKCMYIESYSVFLLLLPLLLMFAGGVVRQQLKELLDFDGRHLSGGQGVRALAYHPIHRDTLCAALSSPPCSIDAPRSGEASRKEY